MRDITDAAGAEMTRLTKQHTPKRTGRTADSFEQTPVERVVGGYKSGVESHYYRARFVEHGVKKHPLAPKRRKALSTPAGPRASAEGGTIKAAHMVSRACVEVEAGLEQIARPHLEVWARDVEQNAKRHRGIT